MRAPMGLPLRARNASVGSESRSRRRSVFLLRAAGLRDDVARTPLALHIDPGDVKPDDAEADHQNAAEKQQQENDGRKAAERDAGDFLIQGNAAEDNGDQQRQHAEEGDDLYGRGGKSGDVGQRVADQPPRRPLGFADRPLLHTVGDGRFSIADPVGQGTEKHIPFRQRVERVHDLAVEQLEVRGVGHIHPGGVADEFIKALGGKAVGGAFSATILLDTLDDLVPLLPEVIHLHDLFRRVLQVTVHDHAAVAGGLGQPGEHGGLFAEVPAEMDAEDVRIFLRLRADDIPGLVPRAVVDEYQFVGDLRTHRLDERPDGDRDHLFFIVSRQDNREHIFSPFGLPVRDGTALARFCVDLGLSVIK